MGNRRADLENTHMFMPCGHKCACKCKELIMGGTAECPTCRTKAVGLHRVFG